MASVHRVRDAFAIASTSSALVMFVRPSMPMLAARSTSSGLLYDSRSPFAGVPLERACRVLRGRLGVLAEPLGRCHPRLGVACLLLGFVGELPRLAVRLLGGRARGVRCLVGQPPRLGQLLGGLLDELLGALLRFLGLALGVLDLVVDLGLYLLAARSSASASASSRSR